ECGVRRRRRHVRVDLSRQRAGAAALTMASHILVVGGSRGIGRAVARRLRKDGATVSVVGRSRPPDSDALPSWSVDVSDVPRLRETRAEIVAAHGPLSGAVLLHRYRGTGDDWAGEIATSLDATRAIVEWSADHLQDLGHGKAIVVVSSIASQYVAAEQ